MGSNKLFLQALENVYDDEFENYMSSLERNNCSEHIFGEEHNKKIQKEI